MRLGELIKQRRLQADMSLQDLADACGCTKSYVWDIEQGNTVNIGLLVAVRISVALSVPVNALAAAALESDASDAVQRIAEIRPIRGASLPMRDDS